MKPEYYFQGKRFEMLDFLPKNYKTILEIGCGDGGFASILPNKNVEYWGVEIDPTQAGLARTISENIICGDFNTVLEKIPKNYFDLIVCNDVIEHMSDHDFFFRSVKNLLKEKGQLVASIPNVRFISNLINLLFRKDWKYTNEGILDATHLRFFTQKSLQRTLKENGYIVVKFAGINKRQFFPITFGGVFRYMLSSILGSDTLFLQFAFRVRSDQSLSDPTEEL